MKLIGLSLTGWSRWISNGLTVGLIDSNDFVILDAVINN